MAGQHEIALHFEEGARRDDVDRVLLAVDDAGLQRRVYLLEVHRRRVAAHGADGVEIDAGRLHADLEPGHVGGLHDRRLLRREVAGAEDPAHVQDANAGFLAQLLGQLVADRAARDLEHVGVVAPDERMGERLELRQEAADRAGAAHEHVDRAELHALDRLLFGAELSVAEDLHLERAVRALRNELREPYQALVRGLRRTLQRGDPQGALLRRRRLGCEHCGRSRDVGEQSFRCHRSSSFG